MVREPALNLENQEACRVCDNPLMLSYSLPNIFLPGLQLQRMVGSWVSS